MQNNLIIKILDLPDLIATDLIQTQDSMIFIAESKQISIQCPHCGEWTDKIHDRRWQNIKDIPIRNKFVIIRLNKKRYRCSCGKRGISERYDSIDSYARKTYRYDKYLVNHAVSRDYSRVAEENGLSFTAIQNAVNKELDPHIQKKTTDLTGVKAISIDEFAILKKHKYGVVISDPINKEIIDILPSRKKNDLIDYFNSWSKKQLEQIKHFSMDMWRPYKSVATEVFPNAEIVIDKFHLVAVMNTALDEIRKQEQNQLNQSHRKKFYMSRMLMKKRGEDLTDKEHKKLIELFKLSSPLERAWELKEEFRDLMQINSLNEAKIALDQWYKRITESKLNPFFKAKGVIKRWELQILNYFKSKITNGFAEGINNKIKLIKRIGYGVPNIQNLRRRVFHSILRIS